MAGFSVSEALGAGFRLIGRKPLTVPMWGVAYFLIAVLPVMLILAAAAPSVIELVRQAMAGAEEPDPYAMLNLTGPLILLHPVMFLSSIAARAIVMNAVFRAVLEPQDDRVFYLRLGAVELWQALVQLCLMVLVGLAIMLAVLGALVVGGVVAMAVMSAGVREFQPWMAGGGVLIALLIGAVILWLFLRLSMAGPMTFAARNFRLFESWTLTRGQAGRLFLLALLIMLILFAIELAVSLVIGLIVAAVVATAAVSLDQAQIMAFLEQPGAWLPVLIPLCLFVAAIACLVGGYVFAIVLAPWAEAYRQLSGPADAATAPAAPDPGLAQEA